MAAPSGQPKNFNKGVMRLSDGTGTPVTLTVPLEQGNYKIGPLKRKLNEAVKYETRGVFRGLGYGKRIYPSLTFSALLGNLIGSSASAPGSLLEMLVGLGAYSANVSTLGANRDMTLDVRLTVEGTDWGDTADETIDAEDCLCTAEFQEGEEGNMLSVTCEVLGSIIITNSTNTVTLSQAA